MSRLSRQPTLLLSAVGMCMLLQAALATYATSADIFYFGISGVVRGGAPYTAVATPLDMSLDMSNLGEQAVTQVGAGHIHILLLTEGGTAFSYGENDKGRTGLGTASGYTSVFTPIDASNLGGRAITQLSTSVGHSLVLTEDGQVFSFGGNSYGVTGLGADSGYTSIATPIDTSNLGGRVVTQVAAGGFHSLLLTEDGTVFSFGDSRSGQTGQGTTAGYSSVATPIDMSNLVGRIVTQVATGDSHSLLLTDDAQVFSFGDNGFGATGLGTTSGKTSVATPIDASNLGGSAITQLSAGWSQSLALTENGQVFSFGSNSYGATGLGLTSGYAPIATPIDTSNLGGRIVTHVDAGFYYSLLLTVPEPSCVTLAVAAALVLLGFHRLT